MKETNFSLTLPFTKIDKEKRTIAGYATTEAIDKQNEVVDYGASKEAFGDWSGNIREMHEPKAVGKAISWEPDDDKRGIKVEAYISKGAEDTWQKILDGTLKAFSIGGQTVNKISQIIKDNSTGTTKNVTKITKFKLSELSLVDNPANPACAFELVKSVDGIPMQTQLVEDVKKIIISEQEDILDSEIKEHRNKADSLAKKVLNSNDLEKLEDENWGVVRFVKTDDSTIKERLIPIPDKVHAVRALEVINKYSLTETEKVGVHNLVKKVLGSDYENYIFKVGGESEKMSKEIMDAIETLGKRLDNLEAKFNKFDADKAAVEPKTQEVAAPVKEGDNAESKSNSEGEVPKEGEKHSLDEAKSAKPKAMTQRDSDSPPAVSKTAVKKEEEEVAEEEAAAEEKVEEEAPVVEKAKNPATSDLKTQRDEDLPPAKVKKSEDKVSKDDTKKLLEEVETLRKRLDDIETKPLPRKYFKKERTFGEGEVNPEDELKKDMAKAGELRKLESAGKVLTAVEKKFIEDTLNKSIDTKFNKSL